MQKDYFKEWLKAYFDAPEDQQTTILLGIISEIAADIKKYPDPPPVPESFIALIMALRPNQDWLESRNALGVTFDNPPSNPPDEFERIMISCIAYGLAVEGIPKNYLETLCSAGMNSTVNEVRKAVCELVERLSNNGSLPIVLSKESDWRNAAWATYVRFLNPQYQPPSSPLLFDATVDIEVGGKLGFQIKRNDSQFVHIYRYDTSSKLQSSHRLPLKDLDVDFQFFDGMGIICIGNRILDQQTRDVFGIPLVIQGASREKLFKVSMQLLEYFHHMRYISDTGKAPPAILVGANRAINHVARTVLLPPHLQ